MLTLVNSPTASMSDDDPDGSTPDKTRVVTPTATVASSRFPDRPARELDRDFCRASTSSALSGHYLTAIASLKENRPEM